MGRKTFAAAALIFIAISGPVVAQNMADMDWDSLPEPHHLTRVLDVDQFLGQRPSAPAPSAPSASSVAERSEAVASGRYVQIGAFRRSENAQRQVDRIKEAGLVGQLWRQGSWYIAVMPQTERNSAETLRNWARRSGYTDAFIRVIR